MFKPQLVKDTISLAHMKDDQLQRMKKSHPPHSNGVTLERSSNATIKRLTWDEMQMWRAQGLCFNCNKLFTLGHRCSQPQLLLLEIEEVEPGIVEPWENRAAYKNGSTLNLKDKVALQEGG